VNVKVNAGPKTAEPIQLKPKIGEDSTFDLKIKELTEKAERGIPVESEVKELIEEGKKNPKIMKRLQGFVQDAQKKPMLKKRIFPIVAAALAAAAAGVAGFGTGIAVGTYSS
jgi:hypothetical protein